MRGELTLVNGSVQVYKSNDQTVVIDGLWYVIGTGCPDNGHTDLKIKRGEKRRRKAKEGQEKDD